MSDDNSRCKPTKKPLPSNKAPLSNKSANIEVRGVSFCDPVPEKNTDEKHNEGIFNDSSDDSILACLSESSSDEDCPFEDAGYSDFVSLGGIKLTSEYHRPEEQVSKRAVLEYLQRKLTLSRSTLLEPIPSTSGMGFLPNRISSLQRSIHGLEASTSGMELLRNRLSSPSLLYSHWRSAPPSPPLRVHHESEPSRSGMEVLRNRPPSLRRSTPEPEPSTSGIDVFRNRFTSPPRRSPSPSPTRRSLHEPGPSTSAMKAFRRRHSLPCRDTPRSPRCSPTTLPPIPHPLTDSAQTSLRPSSPSVTLPPPSPSVTLPPPSLSLRSSLHTTRNSPPLTPAPLRPRHSLPFVGPPHSRFLLPTPPCPIRPLPSSPPKYSHAGLRSPNTSALKPDKYQAENSTESALLRLHKILNDPPISQTLLRSPLQSPSSVPIPSTLTQDLRIPKKPKPDKQNTLFTSLIQAIALTEERKSITEPDVHTVSTRRKGGPYKNQCLLRDARLKNLEKASDNV